MRILVFVAKPRRLVWIVAAVLVFTLTVTPARGQSFTAIKPSPQQVEWQDLEFGVLIHFGANTILDREWGDGTASPQVFNPTEFDAEQWMRARWNRGISIDC